MIRLFGVFIITRVEKAMKRVVSFPILPAKKLELGLFETSTHRNVNEVKGSFGLLPKRIKCECLLKQRFCFWLVAKSQVRKRSRELVFTKRRSVMSKKLISLVLVLALAGIASAAIQWVGPAFTSAAGGMGNHIKLGCCQITGID